MKLKTVTVEGKTYAEIQDGKPVYTHDDGKDVAFDAPATVKKIGELNGEARSHREAKEEALAKLKAFEGIEDPAAAKKALATVKNLDDKKLVDAGEVEKVKNEAVASVRKEFEPVVAERDKLKNDLYAEKIGGSFSRSKFIAEKIAIPGDLMQSSFEKHFEVREGKIVAKDADGKEIFSRTRHGELADFDEALEQLVDKYPNKNKILKGTGSSGSGAHGTNDNANAGKTLTRAEFDKLDPISRASKMKDGFNVVD